MTFGELNVGDVFWVGANQLVKLSDLKEEDKSIPDRKPNSLNLDTGHYSTCPLRLKVQLEKSINDYPKP